MDFHFLDTLYGKQCDILEEFSRQLENSVKRVDDLKELMKKAFSVAESASPQLTQYFTVSGRQQVSENKLQGIITKQFLCVNILIFNQ